MVKTKHYPIFVVFIIFSLLAVNSASAFTIGLDPNITSVNLNFQTGQSYIYQDAANNRYVTWTVTSGTLTGTATIAIDSTTGGTFTVHPTSTCTITMTTTNAYIAVGSIYQTTYTYTYTTGTDKTVTWIFQLPPTPTPTPKPITQYCLIVQTTGQGTTNPLPNIFFFYDAGTPLTLTASPANGWAFSYWLMGDGTNQTSREITLTMNSNQSALAVFTQIPGPSQTPTPTIPPTPIPTPNINYPNSINTDWIRQYLDHWDFFGFIVNVWAAGLTLPGFYIIMALIVSIAIYLQMKSLIILVALWIVVGTFIIVFVPEVAPICYLLYAISFGGILYKIFGQSKE